jgi:hypothetical protein
MATITVRTYIERYVTGTWSDMSSYVVGDIEGEYLIGRPDASDMLALAGRLELLIDNGSGNFSPNQYFQRGTRIRVRTVYDGVSKPKFTGKILSLDPDTLEWGDQYVRVVCTDWLNDAVEYPVIAPELQADIRADQSVAYLLSLMSENPDGIIYHEGRERFEFAFDNLRRDTKAYAELNKIALSEYAPIYIKAGNILVVESANTRHGHRELTTIPVPYSQSAALLTSPNEYVLLTADGIPILANQTYAPNLATGTIQPMDIEIENGNALANLVTIRAYPSRVDDEPVKVFQLDKPKTIAAMANFIKIIGTYADPSGGGQINAKEFVAPMVSGTHYRFTDVSGAIDLTSQITVTERYGTNRFVHTLRNNGQQGVLRQFDIYALGIYPYNPEEVDTGITGSIARHGLRELQFDQKYQEDTNVSQAITDMIADDEKDPRNRLLSITFDASSSHELMQASQYMDVGDLTYVKNVKPPVDTYAYIRGKRFVINTAGVVQEQWYLKETYSLKKGLSPVAMNFSSDFGAQNSVSAPLATHLNNLRTRSYSAWVFIKDTPSIFGHVIMSKCTEFSGDVLWLSAPNPTGTGQMQYNGLFSSPGTWRTSNDVISPLTGTWAHIAVTMDATNANNSPIIYVNGSPVGIERIGSTPSGTMVDDSDAVLMIGNFNTRPADSLLYDLKCVVDDARMYSVALTPYEVAVLASKRNNYFAVTRGLVFQAMAVKSGTEGDSYNQPLDSDLTLIDNMYGLRLKTTYSTLQPSYQLKGANPYLSSFQ